MHHFAVIIDPADDTKADGRDQTGPHVAVGEIAPEQCGHRHRRQNQRAAHGRRTGFDQMRLRAVIAYRLTDFHRCQLADHPRPDDERDTQCRHRREDGAQRDVLKHVERAIVFCEPLK